MCANSGLYKHLKNIMKIQPISFYNIKPNFLGKKEDNFEATKAAYERRTLSKDAACALKTNLFVLNEIKNGKKEEFKKATKEDYEILTAKDIDAPLKRAKWFNPKDGKTYWILKDEKIDENTLKIRVLDKDGAYIKSAVIPILDVLISDQFKIMNNFEDFGLETIVSHGDMVKRFAQVTNPFANYQVHKKSSSHAFKSEDNRPINEINFSFGHDFLMKYFDTVKNGDFESILALNEILKCTKDQKTYQTFEEISETLATITSMEEVTKNGIDIFVSAGNEGKDYFNLLAIGKGVQGVGSLNEKGKISEFSSGRNIEITPHYELGEYKIKKTKDGLNYTGGDWTDVKVDTKTLFPLEGKSAKDYLVSDEEFSKYIEDLVNFNEYEAEKRLIDWENKGKIISEKNVLIILASDMKPQDDSIYYQLRSFMPYRIDENGLIEGDLSKLCGTSFASPKRMARYALNKAMEGVLD